MRRLNLFALIIGALWASTSTTYAGAVVTSEMMKLFSGPVLFKDLAAIVPHAAMTFSAFAWVILMFAILGKLQRGELEQNPALTISKILVAMACMMGSTHVFDQGLQIAEGLADSIGVPQQESLSHRMFNIFHTMESAQESAQKQDERYREEEQEKAKKQSGPVERLKESVTGTTVSYFTNFIVKTVVAAISLVLWFCSWVLVIVDTARYFLVQICSLIFPIFVAGLLTQSFSSQSYSFIFNVIGLFLWPVGWAIGHLGTHALFAAASKVMRVDAITVNDAASKTAQGLKNAIGNGVYDPSVSTDGISSLASLGMGPLTCFVIMMVVTCIWILAVTFKAPHFIQQLVIAGGAGFSSMLSGMGVVAAAAGGVAGQMVGGRGMGRTAMSIPGQIGGAVVGGAGSVARSAVAGMGGGLASSAGAAAASNFSSGASSGSSSSSGFSGSSSFSDGQPRSIPAGGEAAPVKEESMMAKHYREWEDKQKRDALVAARYAKEALPPKPLLPI